MGEEALPFTMILCPLFVAASDTTRLCRANCVRRNTADRAGSSWMNLFSVGIAQESPALTSLRRRSPVMWVVFTALAAA